MIFYLANGHTLCGTQAEAKALDRDFVQHDIPTEKPKLQAYVQELMDKCHAQVVAEQLVLVDEIVAEIIAEEKPVPVPHTNQIVAFEDEWDNFPLSRKAHFASLFCEEARLKIK